jgi:putative copper export protein
MRARGAHRSTTSATPVPGGTPQSVEHGQPHLAEPPQAGRGTTGTAMAVGLGLVGLLVLALVVGGARPAAENGGLPGAGPLVSWGLPVATLAGRIAAVGTVGALLSAAVLLPGPKGRLPAASAGALRAASLWALAWVTATALGAVLTVAEIAGVPLTSLTASSGWTFLTQLAAGHAAVLVTAAAGCIAVAARRCTGTGGAAVLLAAAGVALVIPTVLTGHSAVAENHALAVTNLSVHVLCAAVWVGGLLALLLHGRSAETLAPASRRFSVLALACFLGTGASGLLAAWIVLGGSASALTAASGTGYGWLLAGKTAALVALGAFGWHHRRVTLPGLQAGDPRSFRRFAGVEAGVMLATITLAVALAASPPPVAAHHGSPSEPTAATAPQPAPPHAR